MGLDRVERKKRKSTFRLLRKFRMRAEMVAEKAESAIKGKRERVSFGSLAVPWC